MLYRPEASDHAPGHGYLYSLWPKVFIAILLSLYGWRLLSQYRELARGLDDRYRFFSSYRVPLVIGIGLTADGSRIEPPSKASPVIVVMLRHETLRADVAFWEKVKSLSRQDHSFDLRAYCDGAACIQKINAGYVRPSFPVVCYAELMTLEALFEIDNKNRFAAFQRPWSPAREVSWRGPHDDPSSVARSISE